MAVRYNINSWATATLAVNNVADEPPAVTADGILNGQGNTDPQVYDVIGRTWNFSVKVKM